tara:strand:- start:891 stop:1316 length:426 start_codon:yes stop_codon:yes gene_type:complete
MSELRFDINDFMLDKEAKAAGVWIEMGGDASFKIASFDNPAFTDAFRKATKPYSDLGKDIPEDDQIEIMSRCMSNFVVLDWKGVYDGKEELVYSVENAYRLLKELEWIRSKLITEAQKLENFRTKAKEETAKNSPAASPGK